MNEKKLSINEKMKEVDKKIATLKEFVAETPPLDAVIDEVARHWDEYHTYLEANGYTDAKIRHARKVIEAHFLVTNPAYAKQLITLQVAIRDYLEGRCPECHNTLPPTDLAVINYYSCPKCGWSELKVLSTRSP